MSWWDTSGISSFATQALKNAQKKIDKVLDINEGGAGGETASGTESKVTKTSEEPKQEAETSSSWSSWGSFVLDKGKDEGEEDTRSAWSMPWGTDTSFTRQTKPNQKKSSLKESESGDTESANIKPAELPSRSKKGALKIKSRVQSDKSEIKDTEEKVEENVEAQSQSLEIRNPADDEKEKSNIGADSGAISNTEDHSGAISNTEDHSGAISNTEDHSGAISNLEDHSGDLSEQSEVFKPTLVEEVQKKNNVDNEKVMFDEVHQSAREEISDDKVTEESQGDPDVSQCSEDNNYSSFIELESESSDRKLPNSNVSESGDRSGEPGDRSGEPGDRSGEPGDRSGEPGDRSGEPDDSSGEPGDRSGEPGDWSGEPGDRSFESTITEQLNIEEKNQESHPSEVAHSDSSDHKDTTENIQEGENVIVIDNSVECIDQNEKTLAGNISAEKSNDVVEIICEENDIEIQNKQVDGKEAVERLEEGSTQDTGGKLDENIPISVDSLGVESKSQPVNIPSSSVDIDQYKHSDLPLSPSTASSLGGTDSDTNKLDSSLDTYTSDETIVEKSSNKMTKSDESIPGDDIPENDKISESMGEISPSSSYVKCMIEDAMDDSAKMEDNGSDTPSKSECSRSTGGHDSGDELSTTTSSDIEIISTPTSNGDGSKIVDLSPLKISLQKTRRGSSPTHRRSDSQSSSSTHSREGQFEQLSPGRDYLEDDDHKQLHHMQEGGRHDLFPLSEHFENNQQEKLIKKIAELTEILQARESKMVQMSKDSNDLMETNNILRNQIKQLEELRGAETEDVNNVTSEFTKRLSEAEQKINQVIREKESIKKQLQDTQEESTKKTNEKSQQIQEKDQQISELMQEGEKLSKQQLQSNNIIKKLRAKEKENDSLISSQKKKLEEQKTELEHLRKVCDVKDDLEKKQTDAINQLNAAVQKQEREKSKLKSDLEDAQERVRGLQTALDNSYKEIVELHRSNAAQDSKAAETALSLEMQVREELKSQLEQECKSNIQEKAGLINQIEDLRMTVSRMEKEHNRREDMLRQEISDLQRHLQEDEARNQDLTQNVTSATRPLLRQIESLQSTYAAQALSWEKLEKNLSDRLIENQTQLATMTERERSANEKVMELSAETASLESQNSGLRRDKAHQTAQVEMLKTKVQVLEDAKHSETAQIEAIKQQMSQEISDLKKEKVFLETQLDMEKNKVEQERKKLLLAQEQISQIEKDLQRPQSRGSASPLSVSRADSVVGDQSSMVISLTQDDLDRSFGISPVSSRSTLYESIRQGGGAANLIDNLQWQLKQRDGEVLQLRSDIQQLERTRESMARELVNLTNQNEEIQEKIEELPQLKNQYEELNQRYDALLQMYGEKVEEADELRLDLQDVKEMYKLQIDHLLAK
ncbi:TATA element modulatory factor-like isoform X2 [Ostrea edulis]|uniref:TATA element modulatory factor-like isoform X2 n=1 Tax=Ostrea edulis TaxID=37623 RepID=UPI0024AF24FA|nr:TATA element modulatory factor-like isoform X2 [Ostrea edulis]XP_056019919.1 TATA element modulatory factor-like isoform X2 [Ostrea edulis]